MTFKERMLAIIQHKPVDKIPVHHIQFSGEAASIVLGRKAYVGGAYLRWEEMKALWNGPDAHREFCANCEKDALDIAKACGHDLLRLLYWRWNQKPKKKIDDLTFLFGDPEKRWFTMNYLPEVEQLSRRDGMGPNFIESSEVEPEITEASLREQIANEKEKLKNQKICFEPDAATVNLCRKYPDYLLKLGTESVLIEITSPQAMMAAAQWPELFAELLLVQAQEIANTIPSLAAAGMQVNFTGWDFCSKDAPLLSPSMLRDIFFPALRIIVDACHQHGVYFFYSSDGNFWPVADDFFQDLKIDGWFEVDKSSGMDLRKLRERYPHATFIGNMRVQVLHKGSKQDVEREVMDCMEVAHELGGIVVGVSNMIMPGTPPENVTTMVELIEKNR